MKNRRDALFLSLTVFLGIALSVIIIEIILRILGIGYGRSGHISDPYLHHVNPPSFEYVAHSPAGEFKPFTLSYNKSGFRQRNMEQAKQQKLKLALLGDSFTISRELPYDSTFAGILESNAAESGAIINFGVASYSPVLYLVQWKRIVSDYAPTHVIVQLYVNDPGDDSDYVRHARYSDDKRAIVSVPGPSSGELLVKKWVMKSYFIRFVFKTWLQIKWLVLHSDEFGSSVGGFIEPNPEIPEISKTCMLQLAQAVKSSGAEFIITAIPSKCRLQGSGCDTTRAEFSDRWREWADQNNIRFLDLIPPFRESAKNGKLFFDRDIHFNEYGSRVVAREIMRVWPELFKPGTAQTVEPLLETSTKAGDRN